MGLQVCLLFGVGLIVVVNIVVWPFGFVYCSVLEVSYALRLDCFVVGCVRLCGLVGVVCYHFGVFGTWC